MPNPKVSVIMALRNCERTAGKAVETIINQTFKDWEFVIVDDASTDNTGKILEEYAKKDNRIRLFHNKVNQERCISRNRAIKESIGEYIAVLDGDDYAYPSRLAKQVVYLDTHLDCYLVGARAELIDEEGKKFGESWGVGHDEDITEELEKQNRLVHSSIMFRNTKEFWYRDNMRYAEDYDLFMQMILSGKRLHLLQEILVKYTDKRDLVYNDYLISQKYTQAAIREWYNQMKDNNNDIYEEIDRNNLVKYAPEKLRLEMEMKRHFFSKEYKEAREYAEKLINIDPSSEWRLYYLDTFFGGNIIRLGKLFKRKFK